MAKFSQMMLRGMLDPSRAERYSQVGQSIGQAPGIMRLNEQMQQKQAETQRLLKENANNPARLQQLAQEYLAKGDKDAAEAFTNAATQATAKQTAGAEQGIQGGLQAITQGAMRGVPLSSDTVPDLRSAVQSVIRLGATQAQITDAYQKGVDIAKGAKPEGFTMTPGSVRYEPDPTSPTGFRQVAVAPFKPDEPKVGKFQHIVRKDGSIMLYNDLTGKNHVIPSDVEDQGASFELIERTAGYINDVDTLLGIDPQDVERKIQGPSGWEEGFVGQVLQRFGGTDARDRSKLIIEVKSRLGFEQIDEMKRKAEEMGASGTGLGQISNIEFESLQSTVAALEVSMTAEAQINALLKIRRHLENIQRTASGITAEQRIDWNSPKYKSSGYSQDPVSKTVFYSPQGDDGPVYHLKDGKFVPIVIGE